MGRAKFETPRLKNASSKLGAWPSSLRRTGPRAPF